MVKVVDWLHKQRMLNWVLLCVYFLLVVLPHEVVGLFIVNSLKHLNRSALNSTVLMFSLSIFSIFIYFIVRNLARGDQKRIKLVYLILTLGLLTLVYNTLFVLATESAHFPQYAMMAILLFPLTLNYNATLFWATLLGAADEAYQYFYLNPKSTGYFDFNDIITDLLGAVLGLLFLWSFGIKGKEHSIPWYRKSTFFTGMSILIIGGVLNLLGIISVYPNENGNSSMILLMQKVPKSFWSYDKVGDIYFHVVHPLEGVIIVFMLLCVYAYLGSSKE